jgi:hypothetical protein
MHTKTTVLLIALTLPGPALADAPPTAEHQARQPSQRDLWLEEVRAQRQAWEAKHQAAKEASNARLRRLDPWGAARLEAMERDVTARREAVRDRNEKMHREQQQAQEQAMEAWRQQITPYGWDNRWYYRGY